MGIFFVIKNILDVLDSLKYIIFIIIILVIIVLSKYWKNRKNYKYNKSPIEMAIIIIGIILLVGYLLSFLLINK